METRQETRDSALACKLKTSSEVELRELHKKDDPIVKMGYW